MAGDGRAKELIDLGDRMFARRDPMLTLWQEIADNFYVERSNFIREFTSGEEFADHVTDSFPHLMRRELGNNISTMLRPRERDWFGLTTEDVDRDRDPNNAAYLEWVTKKVKKAIYDPRAKFVDCTKGCDHDFVTFGQAVMSVEDFRNDDFPHLFFRQHHLRDCAWLDNGKLDVDELHRKDKLSARQMKMLFGEDVLARPVKEACKKDPGREFNIRHIVMPREAYDYLEMQGKAKIGKKKTRFVSIYLDADNCKILKEGGFPDFPYIVPRWHKVSGSPYSFSPCTTIALPDGRMMQMMARIILESGEKAVDPPMIASGEHIREVNIAAGALTWADATEDIRKSIMPIQVENNMQVAFAMRQDMREIMRTAWFVEKLTLPPVAGSEQMTAEEVRIRQDEFIRNLLPLFEPMEIEYNTKLLDKAYGLMVDMGAFNNDEAPDDLRGADVSWQFESPLQVATRRQITSQFTEVLNVIAMYAEIAPVAQQAGPLPVDLAKGLKDAIYGIGSPADWALSDEQMAQAAEASAQKAQDQQMMEAINGGALTASNVADASQKVGQAMLPPPPPAPVGKSMEQKQSKPAAPKKKEAA